TVVVSDLGQERLAVGVSGHGLLRHRQPRVADAARGALGPGPLLRAQHTLARLQERVRRERNRIDPLLHQERREIGKVAGRLPASGVRQNGTITVRFLSPNSSRTRLTARNSSRNPSLYCGW